MSVPTRSHDKSEAPEKVIVAPIRMSAFASRVVVALLLVAGAALLWRSVGAILLLFAAIFVALVLRTIANALKRLTHLSENINIILAIVLIAVIVGLVVKLFGNLMAQQIELLIKSLPGAYEKFRGWLGENRFDSFTQSLIPSGSSVIANLSAQTENITAIISGMLLAILGGIYLAFDPTVYVEGFLKLLPGKVREPTAEALSKVTNALRHWLTGQFVVMIVVGFSVAIGLTIIGLPAALALGLIACILEFIPVVGPILSAVPALLIALTVDFKMVLLTLLVFLFVQQIEGNFLSPAVMRRTVSVPSALSLFALYFFGMLFGPLGLILGGPLTVASYVLVRELWMKRVLKQDLPEDQPPEKKQKPKGK